MSQHRVLIFAPFGSYGVHHQLDATVSVALRLRGAEAFVVRCDGLFPVCDVLAWSGDKAQYDCQLCSQRGDELAQAFQLPIVQLRQHITDMDREEIARWVESVDPSRYAEARWGELPLGEWVTSSVYSYFRIVRDGLHQQPVQAAHRGFLISGALTYRALTRILAQYKPNSLFVFNGRFAPYRIAYELAKQYALPLVCHERGFADDTFVLGTNCRVDEARMSYDSTDRWRDIPLTLPELEDTARYLDDREYGKDHGVPMTLLAEGRCAQVREILGVPHDAKMVVAFTSSEYEIALLDDFRSLPSQLAVLEDLVEVFRERSEYLVIRHHPGIGGLDSTLPEREFLGRAYKIALSAPKNVRVVMPAEKISSYDLLWSASASISFYSALAAESPPRGVPSTCFAQAIFRDAASLHLNPVTSDHLRAVVDTLIERSCAFRPSDMQGAFRTWNAFRSKLSVRLKGVGIKNGYEQDVRFRSLAELEPGYDPVLDRICSHVLDGTPLHEQPPASLPSAETELAYLDRHLQRVRERRSAVAVAAAECARQYPRPEVALVQVSDSPVLLDESAYTRRYNRVSAGRCTRETLGDRGRLIECVASISQPFVLFAPPEIRHDEAFLSQALEVLNSAPDCDGVSFGSWIVDSAGVPRQEFFTARAHALDWEAVSKQLPMAGRVAVLLSLSLFRTSALASMLVRSSNGDAFYGEVLGFVRGERMKVIPIPFALLALPI